MLLRFIPLILSVSLLYACKGTGAVSSGNSDIQPHGCEYIVQRDADQLDQLRSGFYFLDSLYQQGNSLYVDISTKRRVEDVRLYWTGKVRESYPPQTSVKLLLKTDGDDVSPKPKPKKYSFCFDLSIMDDVGERISLYMMDDEEVLDFYFN